MPYVETVSYQHTQAAHKIGAINAKEFGRWKRQTVGRVMDLLIHHVNVMPMAYRPRGIL